MSIEVIRSARGLPLSTTDFRSWPSVPPQAIPEPFRVAFEQRLKACELYCSGELSAREVARRVGLSASQVLRFARAALRFHEDGQIFGQRALIPYVHHVEYRRKGSSRRGARGNDGFDDSTATEEGAERGTAGLFRQLLDRHPDVRVQIVSAYCEKGKRLKDIHRAMLASLAACGVTTNEYPFNTSRRAAVALGEFCASLQSTHFRDIALARHGRDAARRADKSEAHEGMRHILRPYSRVEVDAHRIDAIFVLSIQGDDGLKRNVTLRRLVVVVLIDVGSRAVLDHALCLNQTESRLDILAAVERALSDAPPMAITEPGLSCRADSGLPAQVLPNCAFRAIDEFAFDNSLAASSAALQTVFIDNLQARVNLGQCASPEGRGFIESFFKKLTENGYQRLPSTTGNSAQSPKRRDPEKKAHRYHLTLEAAEQILEVIVREYNNTVHGVTGRTPLDYIRAWDQAGGLIRRIPRDGRGLSFLYEQTLRLTIRGGVATGTHPYVQYVGARYRNPQLSHHGKLVGSKIIGVVDRRNIAMMRAYLPSGEPLGIIKAQGRWGLSPHSLKTRRAILNLELHGQLTHGTADPIDSYTTYLDGIAGSSRAAANELARVRRERGETVESPKAKSSPMPDTSPASARGARRNVTTTAPDSSARERINTGVPTSPGKRDQSIEVPSVPDPMYELTLGSDIAITRRSSRR